MVATWWNAAYPYRRQLSLIGTEEFAIPVSHPIFVTYSKADILDQGKVREDFEDIEVLFDSSDDATPSWNIVGRDISEDDDEIFIVFNTIEAVSTTINNYYIYMGNPTLSNQPIRPDYEDSRYLLETTFEGGLGLTFVRPSEDWIDGVSQVANARSTFSFYGPSARLTVEKSIHGGIVELTFDNEDPTYIDTYSLTTMDSVVFEEFDLPKQRHYIRLRTTGDKNPAAIDDYVKIVSYQYSKFIDALDLGEEVYAPNGSFTVVTGV